MIRKTLNIGEMFPMRLKLAVDGEVQYEAEAHSFLRAFMEILRAKFEGSVPPQRPIVELPSSTYLEDGTIQVSTVAISSGKLRLTTASAHGLNTGDYAYVMNVNTITGGTYLGMQEVTNISSTVIELTNTSGLSGTHSDATSIPYIRKAFDTQRALDEFTFEAPQIRPGRGTTANTVSTDSLADPIPAFTSSTAAGTFETSSSATISTPTVGATDSVIEISQDFDNNSGASIDVEEVGLWMIHDDGTFNVEWIQLMVRDVLGGTVTVNDGQTLTVTYELTTDVPATTGGLLQQFNEIFYRQLAQASRGVQTIDNLNSNLDEEGGVFRVSSHAGNSFNSNFVLAGELSDRIGLQVGASTTNVVNTDYALNNGSSDQRFPHGDSTDEFYHSSTYIGPIETSGSNVSFTCHKIFENRSGAGITINDCGLYVGHNLNSGSYQTSAAYCIARFQVSPGVLVANGQIAKLEIIIQSTV